MSVVTRRFTLETQGKGQIIDITAELRKAVASAGMRDGICVVHVPGSTAAITAMEYEPGLIEDLTRALEKLAPRDAHYAHNTHDDNGYAHIRASLLGPSVSIPVIDGELGLGTWQQIVFIDFDTRPRHRELVVQLVGE